jgi:anti-sigma factor RsiW
MRCSSCEPLLDGYLEATLRPREARAVAAHLRLCHSCAALLHELRVVDALLTTARSPKVSPDFTATVVSAVNATQPRMARRRPLALALVLYLGIAWAIAALAASRPYDLGRFAGPFIGMAARDLAAVDAVGRALAPATPVAAATVTGVLLLDLLLLGAFFYGYRRLGPLIALHLGRGPRP